MEEAIVWIASRVWSWPVEYGGGRRAGRRPCWVPSGGGAGRSYGCQPPGVMGIADRGGAGRRVDSPAGVFRARLHESPTPRRWIARGRGRWRSSEVGGGDLCGDGRRPVCARGREEPGRVRKEMRGRRERGRGSGRHVGAGLWGDLDRVEERSSIWASLLSLAEKVFSGDVGSAGVTRADLPNYKTWQNVVWGDIFWVEPAYQTHPKCTSKLEGCNIEIGATNLALAEPLTMKRCTNPMR
jgi:hypothetical protein